MPSGVSSLEAVELNLDEKHELNHNKLVAAEGSCVDGGEPESTRGL